MKKLLLGIVAAGIMAGVTPAPAQADEVMCYKVTVRQGDSSYQKTVCKPKKTSYDWDRSHSYNGN